MSEFFARPGVLVRAGNAAGLVLTLLLYARAGDGWVLFLVLFLTPDISMLGYLAGPRVGAIVYNAVHAYVLPAVLAAGGLSAGSHWLVSASLILFAHIAFDRLLGFGLKYPSGFKDTHIQRL